jgi:hypothetical protein
MHPLPIGSHLPMNSLSGRYEANFIGSEKWLPIGHTNREHYTYYKH